MTTDGAPRLALFDCDGTLVDSQRTIIQSMGGAFAAIGRVAPDEERIRRVVGLRLDMAIAKLAGGLPGSELDAAVDGYRETFLRLHADPDHAEPLYDGALAALDVLAAAGWLLGIATGKSRSGLVSTLDRHGLRGRFVTLQTADDAAGKPSPEMVYRALDETGVAVSRTVVIGDTGFDIAMAANAGARSLGVAWGYHPPEELAEAGAAGVARRFSEVPGLLDALVAR
ncbi:MAG: HAD-IA family hydrolase [Alphaproteobacteria bacterium]